MLSHSLAVAYMQSTSLEDLQLYFNGDILLTPLPCQQGNGVAMGLSAIFLPPENQVELKIISSITTVYSWYKLFFFFSAENWITQAKIHSSFRYELC